MTLPAETLPATVDRMRAERATVAAQREAEGNQAAAKIGSDADRDERVLLAQSKAEAASVEAKSNLEAAQIYAKAYGANRQLYTLLRSLDTLDSVVNSNTRLVLRHETRRRSRPWSEIPPRRRAGGPGDLPLQPRGPDRQRVGAIA